MIVYFLGLQSHFIYLQAHGKLIDESHNIFQMSMSSKLLVSEVLEAWLLNLY